jgi:fibronectin type 3 domain-containing protein
MRLKTKSQSDFSLMLRWVGLVLISVLTAMTSASAAPRVELMWDPSPDDTVTGYMVYCTDVTLHHSSQIDVGNTNTCVVTNLAEGRTYQFYVTAYDATGLESDPSNTLEFSVPLGPIHTIIAAGPDGRPEMRFHASGSEGVRLALQSSTNLINWTTIATATDAGQPLDYSIAIVKTEEKQFFRAVTVPQ